MIPSSCLFLQLVIHSSLAAYSSSSFQIASTHSSRHIISPFNFTGRSNGSAVAETLFVLREGGYHPEHISSRVSSGDHEDSSYAYGICPKGLMCVSMYECLNLDKYHSQPECDLPSGETHGICCPKHDIKRTSKESNLLRPLNYIDVVSTVLPFISAEDINSASEKARRDMRNLARLERELEARGLVAQPRSTEANHHRFFSDDKESRNHSFDGFVTMRSTIELMRKFRLSPFQAKTGLKQLSFLNTAMMSHCQKENVNCQLSKYRSYDGSCNNLHRPSWGKSFIPYSRLLSPDYGDGVDSPRQSKSGMPLPNPRVISYTVAPETKALSKYFTHILMQWGQFLAHDVTRTAITRTMSGAGIICCGEEFQRNPRLLHPSCLPIEIPDDDPFFAKMGSSCMTFVRSAPAPSPSCTVGAREQLNQDTAYLDGSVIYGATEEIASGLRTFRGGKLRVSIIDGREFLPQSDNIDNCNIPPDAGLKCLTAGDNRVNQQVSLVVVQALMLRHHNRMVESLARINPSWSDETLYQEARHIITAQMQHITYNEYLPLIIGKKVMDSFDLFLSDHLVDMYDETTDPGILAGFASAAFRLHTTVRATIPFRDDHNRVIGQLDLSDTFLNPSIVYTQDSFPEMLNGLTGAAMTKFDRFFTTEVTHHLFRRFNASFGLDLVAININRGRDHGIPAYNVWRKTCGLPSFRSFDELSTIMDPDAAAKLASLYDSVDDIDLFVGGNCEYHIKGAIVGPTFACLIAEQFRRLKVGDRFWYENVNQAGSFTEEQLHEIKKVTLASIFCEDEVAHIQKLAFVRPFEKWNPRVPCDQIPKLNLLKWRDLNYWKK